MQKIKGKTAEGLVAHAERALKEHWWYVWGTFGNTLTPSLLDAKSKQYPKYNSYEKHKAHIGETVSDCVGLIKGYCMWDEKQDKPVFQAALDCNTGMMYSKATVKGGISSIPEKPGVCVYMQGHVGVYVGGGWVIECAGGRGVVKTPLKGGTAWTHWFECPFIDYGEKQLLQIKPTMKLCVGDTVTVKVGASDYDGKRLQSWVYATAFEVLKVRGERVVIGLDGQVTAAVNEKNLVKC